MDQQLRVETWQQWENLTRYLLSYNVFKLMGERKVQFQRYGNGGLRQHGIDLIPVDSTLAVVGQSKMRDEKTFRLKELQKELQETDGYPNRIEHFYLFTTANKHTSIHDAMASGPYWHQRRDGSRFEVHVEYWEDYGDLRRIVPPGALHDIFPTLTRHAETPPPVAPVISNEAYFNSLEALRGLMACQFPMELLHWLETWDWPSGCVPETEYYRLFELYHEVSHVKALSNSPDALHQDKRPKIYRSLIAGEPLYEALAYFCVVVRNNTGPGQLNDGSPALCLAGGVGGTPPGETDRWAKAARQLAAIYRRDVLGEAVD